MTATRGVLLAPPGTPRDDPFAGLEAPNYLALPARGTLRFDDLR